MMRASHKQAAGQPGPNAGTMQSIPQLPLLTQQGKHMKLTSVALASLLALGSTFAFAQGGGAGGGSAGGSSGASAGTSAGTSGGASGSGSSTTGMNSGPG